MGTLKFKLLVFLGLGYFLVGFLGPRLVEELRPVRSKGENQIRQVRDLARDLIYENDFSVPYGLRVDKKSLAQALKEGRVYGLRGQEGDLERIGSNDYYLLKNQLIEEILGPRREGQYIVTKNCDILFVEFNRN